MASCHYEPNLLEYLEGGLSSSQRAEIREHLSDCTNCSQTLLDLQSVVDSLNTRTRPAVSQSLFREYRHTLDTHFNVSNWYRHLLQTIVYRWNSFRNTSPALARVVPATAWILIGIFIGASLFSPSGRNPNQYAANTRLMLPALRTRDMKSLEEFLTKSEILMLAIANSSDKTPGVRTENSFEQTTANQLLQQIGLMEKQIGRTGDQELNTYLNQMADLLSALSKTGATDTPQRLRKLRQNIHRNNLLAESRRLHELVQNYLAERKYASAYKL